MTHAYGTERAEYVVNATGVGFEVTRDRSPMMRQLLADGVVEPAPLGGLRLDPRSLAARPGLHFIGNHARAVRWLTSGVGFIQAMVTTVVEEIASR